MRNLFSKPMGALGAPIGAPDRRFIDMGVSDTMPILGGFMSMIGQSMTNDSNEHIAAQTNKTNREINEQQLAWARENYELEKEENRYLVDQAYQRSLADRENERAYQSYKNQIKLMREAGINPALMMHGSSAGHAGASASTVNTVGSPARHNQPGMIPMQTGAPMQNILSDLGQGISEIARNSIERMNAENKRLEIENDMTYKMNMTELEYMKHMEEKSRNAQEAAYWRGLIENEGAKIRLENDKFQVYKDESNFNKQARQKEQEQRDEELRISDMIARSQVLVNKASAASLAQSVEESKQRVREMIQQGKDEHLIKTIVANQEEQIYRKLVAENKDLLEQLEYNEKNKVLKSYRRLANALLDPLKGVISAGVNASTSASKVVK